MSNIHTFKTWHIVVSGFMQSRGTPNGMVQLWNELYHRHADKDTCVQYLTYNGDFSGMAEMIWRQRDPMAPPTICIYGYSWGGPGSMRLAVELERRGLKVKHMVLSDPVYRPPRWLPTRLWLSMTNLPTIHVPRTVGLVKWFYQRKNRPHGHQLIAEDRNSTKIAKGVQLDYTHQYMDDAIEFHSACHLVADSVTIPKSE